MTRGTVLIAARRQNKGAVISSAIFLALCLAVLGINWKSVYAFVTGPYQFASTAVTAQKWWPDLAVLVAATLALLAVLWLIVSLWNATNARRHPAFKRLKGDATQIAMKVEDELISARKTAKAGPFYITKSWMVALEPVLLIYPMSDLMGVGHREKAGKSGVQHSLVVWQRGVNLNDTVSCSEAEATEVITRLAEKTPWVLISDPAAFEKRWRANRQQTEKEVDERRLHVSRAG